MIKEAIEKAVKKNDLREAEMMAAMEEIMDGTATQAQIAALITALRMKGETVEEVTGAARIMRQKASRVNACATTIVDTCGTGGDSLGTFSNEPAAGRRRAFYFGNNGASITAYRLPEIPAWLKLCNCFFQGGYRCLPF